MDAMDPDDLAMLEALARHGRRGEIRGFFGSGRPLRLVPPSDPTAWLRRFRSPRGAVRDVLERARFPTASSPRRADSRSRISLPVVRRRLAGDSRHLVRGRPPRAERAWTRRLVLASGRLLDVDGPGLRRGIHTVHGRPRRVTWAMGAPVVPTALLLTCSASHRQGDSSTGTPLASIATTTRAQCSITRIRPSCGVARLIYTQRQLAVVLTRSHAGRHRSGGAALLLPGGRVPAPWHRASARRRTGRRPCPLDPTSRRRRARPLLPPGGQGRDLGASEGGYDPGPSESTCKSLSKSGEAGTLRGPLRRQVRHQDLERRPPPRRSGPFARRPHPPATDGICTAWSPRPSSSVPIPRSQD